MLDFLQSLLDGVMFGATYALIGIGFTLVFGVMHKINMAYAAASVGGAYCGLLVLVAAKAAPAWAVFLAAFVAGGVIGYLIYLACFHFIPLASPLATLMSTVGMLLLIDEIIVHATDGVPQNYPAMFDDVMLRAGEFTLRGDLLLVFGVRVVGVNAATFVITGLLGGLAGAMIGASVGTLSPLLTTPLTVKGLIVTVIGGLGSIPGAIIA